MSRRSMLRQIVDVMPAPIAERVLPWKRAAFRAAGVAPGRDSRTRLLIGPVNSAGQGYQWARAAERIDGVSATDFMYRSPGDVFGYPSDQSVDTVYFRTNRRWQRAQRRAVQRRYTHVIVESGRQLFGTTVPVVEQISALQRKGLRVALLWHGSDIRLPSRHASREPDSPFRAGRYAETDRLEAIALSNHALMDTGDLPVFVSTPDLLAEVPAATWLPVVVDVATWDACAVRAPMKGRSRPVVVHAPSNAGLKGSDLVTGLLHRLHEEELIDYREVRGVPASAMPAVYGAADIVLDQFGLGIYGVAACEAMAAGRIVVSHVSDQVRESVRRLTGDELPIVEARAGELEQVLRRIVAMPDVALTTAARGPEFVHSHHEGSRSAEALRSFLLERA